MPQQRKVLRVFLASPSDVADERDVIEAVISELNYSIARSQGVLLELVRWETHAIPGVAADAQARVNETAPQDYDIFIGLFWTRAGTKTLRADSGSIEEYEIARAKLDRGENVEIMLYFKQSAPPLAIIDAEQFGRLRAFQEKLKQTGVLSAAFDDEHDLAKQARIHLSLQITRMAAESPATREQTPTPVLCKSREVAQPDDEPGLLDLEEVIAAELSEMTAAVERISEATSELGDSISAHADRMNEITDAAAGPPPRNQSRQLISAAASDMISFAAKVEPDIPVYKRAFEKMAGAIVAYTSIVKDLGEPHQAGEALPAITQLQGSLLLGVEGMEALYGTIVSLPRMTADLNKAKRAAGGALERLLSELRGSLQLLKAIEDGLRAAE